MLVLIACEMSGVVRRAFLARGHDAYSCDLIRSLDHSPRHLIGDALDIARAEHWDLLIAHPPCTHLAASGARWFKDKRAEQAEAIGFVENLWRLPIPKIAVENPVGILSTSSRLGAPTQIIQPWMFGHGETKATCLWLKGLKRLHPTDIVNGRVPRVHWESNGLKNGLTRAQRRSITYSGIAQAMANQWG